MFLMQEKWSDLVCEHPYGRHEADEALYLQRGDHLPPLRRFTRNNHFTDGAVCWLANSLHRVELLSPGTGHVTCDAIWTRYVCLTCGGGLVITVCFLTAKRGLWNYKRHLTIRMLICSFTFNWGQNSPGSWAFADLRSEHKVRSSKYSWQYTIWLHLKYIGVFLKTQEDIYSLNPVSLNSKFLIILLSGREGRHLFLLALN